MRTLLGVFRSPEDGRAAVELLNRSGFAVQTIGDPEAAAAITRDRVGAGSEGPEATASAGAVMIGLASGGVGAVPGALLGKLVGGWLDQRRVREYERDVAGGGVLLVVRAPELAPAARAEAMLYETGAVHVESGETPRV